MRRIRETFVALNINSFCRLLTQPDSTAQNLWGLSAQTCGLKKGNTKELLKNDCYQQKKKYLILPPSPPMHTPLRKRYQYLTHTLTHTHTNTLAHYLILILLVQGT